MARRPIIFPGVPEKNGTKRTALHANHGCVTRPKRQVEVSPCRLSMWWYAFCEADAWFHTGAPSCCSADTIVALAQSCLNMKDWARQSFLIKGRFLQVLIADRCTWGCRHPAVSRDGHQTAMSKMLAVNIVAPPLHNAPMVRLQGFVEITCSCGQFHKTMRSGSTWQARPAASHPLLSACCSLRTPRYGTCCMTLTCAACCKFKFLISTIAMNAKVLQISMNMITVCLSCNVRLCSVCNESMGLLMASCSAPGCTALLCTTCVARGTTRKSDSFDYCVQRIPPKKDSDFQFSSFRRPVPMCDSHQDSVMRRGFNDSAQSLSKFIRIMSDATAALHNISADFCAAEPPTPYQRTEVLHSAVEGIRIIASTIDCD